METQPGMPQEGSRVHDYRFLVGRFFAENPDARLPVSFVPQFGSSVEPTELFLDRETGAVCISYCGQKLILSPPRKNPRSRECRFTADAVAMISAFEAARVRSVLSDAGSQFHFGRVHAGCFNGMDLGSFDVQSYRNDACRLLREYMEFSPWSESIFGGRAYMIACSNKDTLALFLDAIRRSFETQKFAFRHNDLHRESIGARGLLVRELFLPVINSAGFVGARILSFLASNDPQGNGFHGIVSGPGDSTIILANSRAFLAPVPDFRQIQ